MGATQAGCVPTSVEAAGAPSAHSPSRAVSEGGRHHTLSQGRRRGAGCGLPPALSSQCTDKMPQVPKGCSGPSLSPQGPPEGHHSLQRQPMAS